jgi:hypothetical protein
MIRAAASGRLDFGDADSDSIQWMVRERLILQEVERTAILELQKARHLQMAASTTWPDFDSKGEVYKHHFSVGKDLLADMENLLLPYDKVDKKEYYRREMDDLRAEYTATFGDPSSPEAQEQARRDSAALERQRVEAKQNMRNEMATRKKQAEQLAALRRKRNRRRKRA